MDQKRVLLIIGGGIAAYKTPELVRAFDQFGFATRVILTNAGSQFVTPLTLASLTHDQVHTELFDLTAEAKMGHIELSRSADVVVVAPATADLMAKMANGLANDLASTALLATDKRVIMAPSMNVRMWESAPVQRNIAQLKADGVMLVGPDEGAMACGEFGLGRMAEPAAIAQFVQQYFETQQKAKPLTGMHAIVTAGPTREAIDPVRYLSNRSSGKQGYALAAALMDAGANVTLVTGPTALQPPAGVNVQAVESARDMLSACQSALPCDIFIGVAAVADWYVADVSDQKLKLKSGLGAPTLNLVENPDILATMAQSGASRPKLVIGFAAETNNIEDYAKAKLLKKGCDWIVANDVSGDVMGGDANEAKIYQKDNVIGLKRASKTDIANQIVEQIADHFAAST